MPVRSGMRRLPAHRFSRENGYDNPSVYCDDLYATLSHVQSALETRVYVSNRSGQKLGIGEAIAAVQ